MPSDPLRAVPVPSDDWLEGVCRSVEAAGRSLEGILEDVNVRTEEAQAGRLGRRHRITDEHLRQAETACDALRDALASVQTVLFDCEQEMRTLQEREVSVAELLIDGESLISQYRFLRRVSQGLRLFGARPSDTLEPAGPMAGRLARSLEFPSRRAFLEEYRERTRWVRALYDRVVPP